MRGIHARNRKVVMRDHAPFGNLQDDTKISPSITRPMITGTRGLVAVLGVLLPVLGDELRIGRFGSHQEAIARGVFLPGTNREGAFYHGGEAKVGLVGMDANVLRCPKVFRTAKNRG